MTAQIAMTPAALPSSRRRIWGWMFFDWAQQPYATLGLTFIFGPYFAAVATQYYLTSGLEAQAADVASQRLWSTGQTVAGVLIALTAPFLGVWADRSGRKMPWIAALSVVYIVCAALLWRLQPDGSGLYFVLVVFWIGFIAGESALNVNNAQLPSLGDASTIGRISGSAGAFGYWGGVVSLFVVLLFFDDSNGATLIGLQPPFGLDTAAREGTRSVGPIIAVWFALFIIPFFALMRDPPMAARGRMTIGAIGRELWRTIRSLRRRRSLGAFLLASMLYRDALNAVYSFGGIYAVLVLGWKTIDVGIFGIVAAISAAVITWAGGLADQRFGPKPVIRLACWALIVVSIFIVGMSRQSLFGMPLADGSRLPDIIFYLCGAVLGGAGGVVYTASRTMMVRHTDPSKPGEAFGLFALSGRATAFLAPALITLFNWLTGSVQLSFLPVIGLFVGGLILLRFVDPNGDRTA